MPLIRKRRKLKAALLASASIVYDVNLITNDFLTQINSDGGYVEAIDCLKNEIITSPLSDEGRVIFDAFSASIVSDGGYTEAKSCTINEINDLI